MRRPRVPDALIHNLCHNREYRLPKLTRLVFPAPQKAIPVVPYVNPYPVVVHQNRTTMYPDRGQPLLPAAAVVAKAGERPGNLSNNEYRFFIGRAYPLNNYSECRWCHGIFYSAEKRTSHTLASDCKGNLLSLYRRMRHDKICVMCDKRTGRVSWGLPLCSDECVSQWRFALPESVQFEQRVMEKEGKLDA